MITMRKFYFALCAFLFIGTTLTFAQTATTSKKGAVPASTAPAAVKTAETKAPTEKAPVKKAKKAKKAVKKAKATK